MKRSRKKKWFDPGHIVGRGQRGAQGAGLRRESIILKRAATKKPGLDRATERNTKSKQSSLKLFHFKIGVN